MIADDTRRFCEPEIRYCGQQFTLSWNNLLKHNIKGRKPVGGDDEHVFVIDGINVAYFAAGNEFEVFENGFADRGAVGGVHGCVWRLSGLVRRRTISYSSEPEIKFEFGLFA